jgi:hypothetical protein
MENLKDVAHISGKSGLYKIFKPTKTGVIVETLDEKKEKTVVGGNARVSVMSDISVFMDDHQDSSKPLSEILKVLNTKYPDGLPTAPKDMSERDLIAFFLEIEPNFDREKVYTSDIKKILNWYGILKKQMPELFVEEVAEAVQVAEVVEQKVEKVAKPKKAKAKE